MKQYILMLMALVVAGCSAEEEKEVAEVAKSVKVVELGDANTRISLTFPGKVIAGEEAEITFKVAGKLNKLPAKEGMQVKKGELIAQLDQKDYLFSYRSALSTFNEKKAAYGRAQELIKNKYISQADFDKKREAYEVSRANLNIAKNNLNYTSLKAPFAGEIAIVYVDNFQNVQVKEDIVKLQNLEFLEVKVSVPERVMANARKKHNIVTNVRFDARPERQYEAEITEVATRADPITQTYLITVRLPRPDNKNILPGMTAVVEFAEDTSKPGAEVMTSLYSIPANAIFSDNEKNSFVWLVNDEQRLVQQPITAKAFNDEYVKVENGLKQGDMIVVNGVNFLQSNQLVNPYKEN